MKPGFLILIAMLVITLGLAACGQAMEVPTREVKVQADDVTLHV